MKDQYAGDVNDYRKYGLLRALGAGAGLSTAVCWMLTPPDGRTDGRHTDYLRAPERWRAHDPGLFDALASIVAEGGRSVERVERCDVLGASRFWRALVPERPETRDRWLGEFLEHAAGADLVFFDPDNGLEVPSVRLGRRGSSKYLYWHEVERAYGRGHSLLIYQHFPRQQRERFTTRLAAELGERTGAGGIAAVRTANVLFLLAMRPEHAASLHAALAGVRDCWQGQLDVGWPGRPLMPVPKLVNATLAPSL